MAFVSHLNKSAAFDLISGDLIDSNIQVSLFTSPVNLSARQILWEHLGRCWRGGWRWVMSWGTENWLWVESAKSGDGGPESFLKAFSLAVFSLSFLRGLRCCRGNTHRGRAKWGDTNSQKFPPTCYYVHSVTVKKAIGSTLIGERICRQSRQINTKWGRLRIKNRLWPW